MTSFFYLGIFRPASTLPVNWAESVSEALHFSEQHNIDYDPTDEILEYIIGE